jgi:uncharacterized protein YukE
VTAGEQARQVLTSRSCITAEEQATPCGVFKIFMRILEKYNKSMPEDLHLTLEAFAGLLQESTSSKQITKKAVNAVAIRVEEKMEATLERSLSKMSTAIESITANQKDLQGSATTITGATEALQKLTQEMGNSVKETSETSNQLTTAATTYRDALLTASNKSPQAGQPEAPMRHEDPRLTRDLDCKQCQILLELGKEFTEGKSAVELKETIDTALSSITPLPPEGAKVQEINKLRNGGIVVMVACTICLT